MVQRTFVMLKSNVMDLGQWPELVLNHFIRPGFNICALKMIVPTSEQLEEHFKHLDPAARKKVIKMTLRTPVIIMVVEGDEAVSRIHDAAGSTAPGEATRSTIRRQYGHVSKAEFFGNKASSLVNNTIHTSATQKEAEAEIANFFDPSEIFEYRFVYSRYGY